MRFLSKHVERRRKADVMASTSAQPSQFPLAFGVRNGIMAEAMTMKQRPTLISVIGGSNAAPPALEDAYQIGLALAQRGAVVICGGLTGVMEAVCRGAKDGGGVTIGILPGDVSEEANAYVDYPITTGMGYMRNAIVAKAGRAVIAIDGAYGTLSEIGHALGEGATVIGLNTWRMSVDGVEDTAIIRADTPADAVEKAMAVASARQAAI